MKKALNILKLLVSAVIGLLALVFAVIEGRNLFSGDWQIYEYAFGGFVRYLSRLILALFALLQAMLPLINRKRTSETLAVVNVAGSVGLVVISVFLLMFATNYVGEVAMGISMVNVILVGLTEHMNRNGKENTDGKAEYLR